MSQAREWYGSLCEKYMHITQGWLEWSKLEEDIGNIRRSLKILSFGLYCNPFNENLVAKAIKLFERTRSLQMPRKSILSSLKHENIQNVWKSVFEGALLEARDGNTRVAREFYRYLLEGIHWYGPIYYEAYRLEEKVGCYGEAVRIIRAGLQSLPKYGPLWFGLLRMLERFDIADEISNWLAAAAEPHTGSKGTVSVHNKPRLHGLRTEVPQAVANISKELVWKVYFELSMAEQRAAVTVADLTVSGLSGSGARTVLRECLDELLGPARVALAKAAAHCPQNLRWKVWTAGARLELQVDAIHRCRALLQRAMMEVPAKSKSQIYIECARVEEYSGDIAGARMILNKACDDVCGDWKLFLEAVLLECRAGRILEAVQTAEVALQQHSGTGRLWAVLIQLHHRRHLAVVEDDRVPCESHGNPDSLSSSFDNDAQFGERSVFMIRHRSALDSVLHRALHEVPKSGEVWCEAARTHMNPLLLDRFDLGVAQTHLSFAIQFTPQYGDTFIEYLRSEVLSQVMLPKLLTMLGLPAAAFLKNFLCKDRESDVVAAFHHSERGLWLRPSMQDMVVDASEIRVNAEMVQNLRCHRLVDQPSLRRVNISELERRCLCADPNYGALWFHCRASAIDCPTQILDSALNTLSHELCSHQALYSKALLSYVVRCLESTSFALVSGPRTSVTLPPAPSQMLTPQSSGRHVKVSPPVQAPGVPQAPMPLPSLQLPAATSGYSLSSMGHNAPLDAVSLSLDSGFPGYRGAFNSSRRAVSSSMMTTGSSGLSASCTSLPYQSSEEIAAMSSCPLTPRTNREQMRHGRLGERIRQLQLSGSDNLFLDPDSFDFGSSITVPNAAIEAEWQDILHNQDQLWSKYLPGVLPILQSVNRTSENKAPKLSSQPPGLTMYDGHDEVGGERAGADGEYVGCGDFISSIVSFNRLQFRSGTTAAQHRHLLFATDEIIP
jgi:tetratricopeptide (TPR) repeat protein